MTTVWFNTRSSHATFCIKSSPAASWLILSRMYGHTVLYTGMVMSWPDRSRERTQERRGSSSLTTARGPVVLIYVFEWNRARPSSPSSCDKRRAPRCVHSLPYWAGGYVRTLPIKWRPLSISAKAKVFRFFFIFYLDYFVCKALKKNKYSFMSARALSLTRLCNVYLGDCMQTVWEEKRNVTRLK